MYNEKDTDFCQKVPELQMVEQILTSIIMLLG